METLERNKLNRLIAEFMGFKMVVTDYHGINIIESPEGKTFDLHGLKYHSSWDWLIPVIDRITSMNEYYKYIDAVSGQFETKIEINTRFIERTHEDVIDFITWYNKQGK